MKKLPFGKNAIQLANVFIDMMLPYKEFVHSCLRHFYRHKNTSCLK